jgi:HEPN domain-containing protein
MNTHEGARRSVDRAALILDEAEYLRGKGAWNLVVRRCQEAIELALKSALLWAGIEVPRTHDVGPVLKHHEDRFPESFRVQVSHLASISRSLRAEREISFYGDEQSGVPPEELYTQEDADEASAKAREVLEACHALITTPEGDTP